MPSVSQKQHNLMAMVANDPEAAKRVGIPQSVGKEFTAADKGKKFRSGPVTRPDRQKINKPKTDHGQSALFKRGGEMKESKAMAKKEIAFMEKKGAPKSMIKHEKAEYGMKAGGRMPMKGEHAVQTKAKRGAQMVKMAAGGLASGHKSADGIAQRGKTKATQVKMAYGGKACK